MPVCVFGGVQAGTCKGGHWLCVRRHGMHMCIYAGICVCAHVCACTGTCVHVLTRVCVQACVQASECTCMGVPRLGVRICVYTPVHACARMQWCSLVWPYDLQPLLLLPGARPLWGCMWGAHTTLAPTPLPGKPKTGIFFSPTAAQQFPYFGGGKEGVWGVPSPPLLCGAWGAARGEGSALSSSSALCTAPRCYGK